MIVYLDSSVLLRIVFAEKTALKLDKEVQLALACEILIVECFKSIERIRHSIKLSNEEIAGRSALIHNGLKSLSIIKISTSILARAKDSFPTTIKTLDAIHLASALAWQRQNNFYPIFLTHDEQLGRAAKAVGFEVLGC